MAKILVTGANGQLGMEIRILSNTYSQYDYSFHDIDTLDLTNLSKVSDFLNKNKFNFLINCAAYTAVDKAEDEPEKAFLMNAQIPGHLAEICKDINTKFIHISSDYVFDGHSYLPYKESDKTNPQSIYGSSKLEGERKVLSYNDAVIIRTSWLYSSFSTNFVKTILRIAKEKKELNIIFDQVGTPTYAADLASAIYRIVIKTIKNSSNYIPGIYHYSNHGVCSWYDFAKEIVKYANINCKINPIETKDYPLPAKRPFYSVLNKAKIQENYDVDIPYWSDSLKKCLDKILAL